MNDSRQLFVDHVNAVYRHSEFRVDEEHPRWDKRIRETLLDSVFYTICAYIRKERDSDNEWGMGTLEREFLCSWEFSKVSPFLLSPPSPFSLTITLIMRA